MNTEEITKRTSNTSAYLKKMHRDSYCIEVEVLDGGSLPLKKHATDAGFDLFATSDFSLNAGNIMKHPLNIKLKLPIGTYASVEARSSLGLKGQIMLSQIIDEEYRGIPHVVTTTVGLAPLFFNKGDRIGQLVLHPHSNAYYMEQVEKVETDTKRSDGGFGSTGV